jgi:hypothetical protein
MPQLPTNEASPTRDHDVPSFRSNEFALIAWSRGRLKVSGWAAVALGVVALAEDLEPASIAFGMVALGALAIHRSRRERIGAETRGELVVDADFVRFGGRQLAIRRQLRSGFIVPDRGGNVRVELVRALRSTIELRAMHTDDARQLLRVLGFDASQRTTSFSLMSRLVAQGRWIGAPAAAILFLAVFALPRAHLAPGSILFVVALSIAFVVAAFATRTKMTIGADGIYARDAFGQRFVAYTDVAGVGTYQQHVLGKVHIGIVLTMRDGTDRRFLVGQVGFIGDRAMRIVERIREALDSARREEPASAIAMLERGGRALPEWLGALRSIGAGANVDLRTAPVSPETLWRIVEDPRAPQRARASAAVALGAQLDAASRARLRVTAAATAAPKLRIALDAAVDGDDEAVADALAELARDRTLRER